MSLRIDPQSPSPAYVQIADWIGGRIKSGELAAGSRLPAERALAAETGAARGTVKAAYRELERRGRARIQAGSGVYVNAPEGPGDSAGAAEDIREVVARLRELGLNRGEIAALAQDCAWSRLQEQERPRLAWVDCCPEMLGPIARQIEVECGFSVGTMLLEEVAAAPECLEREYFHAVSTTIEHYEELDHNAREVLHRMGVTVDRVVLSLTPETVGAIAGIASGERVAVAHDTPVFFSNTNKYLAELGVKSNPLPIALGEEALPAAGDMPFQWLVLPPDERYRGGECGRMAKRARQLGAKTIHLCHTMDFGSLRYLKARARSFY